MVDLITLNPACASHNVHILLAHGAGAPMTSPFLENLCLALAEHGVGTTRFEFAYMASRRTGGSRRPPPKAEKLIPEFVEVLESVKADLPAGVNLAIGGKSMGGRVASMIAQERYLASEVCGLVCVGYPFHPPKKPDNLRTAHMKELTCPTLIIQGERDALGTLQEVAGMNLPEVISVHWLEDGDHDLKPRVRSGYTQDGHIREAAGVTAEFLNRFR